MSIRSRLPLSIIALVIAVAAAFASPAGAQQKCSDEDIVGSATSPDRAKAYVDANSAWQKEAVAKMGAKVVYHATPGTKCVSSKGASDYTCTVSAKACTSPPVEAKGKRSFGSRFQCHAAVCEVCCLDPSSGREFCRPICM